MFLSACYLLGEEVKRRVADNVMRSEVAGRPARWARARTAVLRSGASTGEALRAAG